MSEAGRIVDELAWMDPEVSDPERGVYCFFCNEEDQMVRPLIMAIRHHPSCLWLAARDFLGNTLPGE